MDDYLRLATYPDRNGRRVRLAVSGELDCQTAPRLRTSVTETLDRRRLERLQLDLSNLTFIDAAGVRCLLECEREASRAGVCLIVRNVMPAVLRILEIVDLAGHFGLAAGRVGPEHTDSLEELQAWSIRARRQAFDTCARAHDAVRRSHRLRDTTS
jgi:anti-anti-sigma factor